MNVFTVSMTSESERPLTCYAHLLSLEVCRHTPSPEPERAFHGALNLVCVTLEVLLYCIVSCVIFTDTEYISISFNGRISAFFFCLCHLQCIEASFFLINLYEYFM